MLLVGVLVGLVNGYFIARFRMPAFMMTLVALMFCSSLAIWITQSQNIVDLPEAFTRLGSGDLVSFYFGEKATPEIRRRDILPFVTYPTLIALALAIGGAPAAQPHDLRPPRLCHRQQPPGGGDLRRPGAPHHHRRLRLRRLLRRRSPPSSIPRGSKAGGRRSAAARRCSTSSARPSSAAPRSSGGKGKVPWTFVGVLFFVLLSNTLNYMRLSAFHIDVVKGAIILAAALLDVLRTRLVGAGPPMSDTILALDGIGKSFFGVPAAAGRDAADRGAAASSASSGRTAPGSRR